MKLVQKILSHGLLITFIVLAFFAYMNRVELFPQWFSKPAPAAVSHAPAVVEEPAATVSVPAAERIASSAPAAEAEVVETETDLLEAKQEAPVSAGQSPAVEPGTGGDTAIAEPADGPEQSGATVMASAPVSDAAAAEPGPLTEAESPGAAAAVEAEVTQPAVENENAAEEAAVRTGAQPADAQPVAESALAAVVPQPANADSQSVFRQQLELARAYFWKRDIQAALQAYRILAENWPDHAEVWGEMGNLYFSIRKKPEAVNAYAHAIELLAVQGDRAQARALLDVVYRLDARRAGQLEMSLRQAGG